MLAKECRVDATLVEGGRGVFDVALDGDVVFSKDQTGRFPRDEEIIRAVRERGTGESTA